VVESQKWSLACLKMGGARAEVSMFARCSVPISRKLFLVIVYDDATTPPVVNNGKRECVNVLVAVALPLRGAGRVGCL